MIEQQQISSVPLLSQISLDQENPSKEHPSEKTEIVTTDITKSETEENQEPVLVSPIVEEISESGQVTEEISESEQLAEEISEQVESEQLTEEISEQLTEEISEQSTEEISEQSTEEISEQLTEEISEQLTEEISEQVESEQLTEEVSEQVESEQLTEEVSEQVESEHLTEEVSEQVELEKVELDQVESEQVIKETIYNEQESVTSVTNDSTKDPVNIEAAQLEISNILSNTISTENDQPTEVSPLLTYVADNNLDSLPTSIPSQPSQEGSTTMSLQHLEYDIVHATGWDTNYPPHQLLPKDKNFSSEGGINIKYGKGWQSERQCTYPQEIIIQVSCGTARIRKLQILSHHYKIATKFEIYVGSVQQRKEMVGMEDKYNGGNHDEKRTLSALSWDKLPKMIENDGINPEETESEESEDNDYEIVKPKGKPYILFRRLGYCALDSNERANYKARELKSVRLDTEGEYIRLVARRCHSNHLNQYNQVGIVGITVMGEQADHLLAGESQKIPIEHADEGLSRVASPETVIVPFIQDLNDQRNFTPLYSILPNSLSVQNNNSSTATPPLSNDTNNNQTDKTSNPITANDFLSNGEGMEKLLAAFSRAKQAAVKVEDFNMAKIMKYCIELVQKASEEVFKLEKLKKQAVEEENFDDADRYKREIEAIREEVRGILADEGLDLDESGEVIMCDLQDIVGLADDVENDPNVNGVPSGNDLQYQQDLLFVANNDTSIDRSGARAPEPIFPSMSKSRSSSDASLSRYLDDRSLISKEDYQPRDEFNEDVPVLSELAKSAFALSLPFFGDNVIARLLSKNLALKESAITEIIKRIDIGDSDSNEGVDKLSLVKATYQVMQEALTDISEELSLQVLTLWEKLIKFCVHYQIPNSSTWKFVDKCYECLFNKIADPNERVKQNSIDLFILLARTYRTPTQSVLSLVLKPPKSTSQPLKRAKPTVDLVTRLVEEFGVVVIPKGKFDKDNKLSLDAIMELSVSYLNHNHVDVHDAAVKLVFEIIKRIGRVEVAKYLTDDVQPESLESILNLLKEWEETTGKVAGELTPPSSPKQPRRLTDEDKAALKNFEVDEKLLQKPLAKRGTFSRMEQQLMEVRQMVNNTNHIIKEEYDDYIANATKVYHKDGMGEEELLAAEEALVDAALEAEEERIRQLDSQTQKGKTGAANKKTPAARGSKSAAPSKTAPKKSKDDGKAAPSKKTSTSKSSSVNSKAKPESRRGSTDATKGGRKNSVNLAQNKVAAEPERVTEDPDESKGDRCCIFCDTHDDRFTEDNLVTHYWNDCPVLTNCRLCNIILEISTLDDHMLNDCDKSRFVKQCPRCREVIEADDYLEHMAKQSCMAIRPDIVRCPLCKTVVKPATEQGWKSHLLDENGCTKNRKKSRTSAATSMVKEMEAAAIAESREKKSTSATKSSATSKAPARKPTTASKDKLKKTSTTKVSKTKK